MNAKKIIFLTLLINNIASFAQIPTWVWAKSAGGLKEELGNFVSSDTHGNIYVCGHFNSSEIIFGDDTLHAIGAYDMYIAKYDSLGDIIWAKSVGGIANDYATAVCTDHEGNIFMTGYFDSPAILFDDNTVFNHSADTTSDIFVIKYSQNGNVLWGKSIGGSGSDLSYGISSDANSNIYLTGYYDSPSIIFGNDTIQNAGFDDLFILKYNSSGIKLWAKSIGGSTNDNGRAIATDSYGNIFIVGEFDSPTINFESTTLSNVGAFDVFISKLNSNGTVLWAMSAGGFNDDKSIGLSTDITGNVYATGFFLSTSLQFNSEVLTGGGLGNGEIWIVKYDGAGNIIWAKSAGGTLFDKGMGIANNGNGGAYLTGYFISDTLRLDNDTLYNAGSNTRDFYIVNYDDAGNALWAYSAGGIYDDFGFSICTNGNDIYVTGKFDSPEITFGNTTSLSNFNNIGTSDMFLVKLNYQTNVGIKEKKATGSKINIFPNPTKNKIYVELLNPGKSQVEIFNLNGQLLQSFISQSSRIEIDINNLTNQPHIVRIRTQKEVITKKIIKIE